jgi:hypothetical protein
VVALATVAKADAVLDWNEIAVNTAIANGQAPIAQARYAAIVQLAVFEAVNSITGDYRPYLGTIEAPHGASPDAAAIEAAYLVLSTYFPASASLLGDARKKSLALIPEGDAKNKGIAAGDAAACHDRASCQGRLVAGTVQDTGVACSRRMAGHAELSNREWSCGRNFLSMAEHNPFRYPECK